MTGSTSTPAQEPPTPVAPRSRRPTSADVAREAGVSRATVSYVLNDTPRQTIPEATRRRVLEAVDRLRYNPSAPARTLSRGRSDIVLALLPAELVPHSQFSALVEHMAHELAHAGLTLVTHPWSPAPRPTSAIWSAVHPVAVIALQALDPEVAALREAGTCVLALDDDGSFGDWARGIQHEIARVQVEALAAGGHHQLGYAAPPGDRMLREVRLRQQGLDQACRLVDLPAPVRLPVPVEPGGARGAIAAWREGQPRTTAVCAHDDITAMAVLAGARHHGLHVPDDLAVVGVYDGPATPLTFPPLTSVAIDSEAMARYASTALLLHLQRRPEAVGAGPRVARLVRRTST